MQGVLLQQCQERWKRGDAWKERKVWRSPLVLSALTLADSPFRLPGVYVQTLCVTNVFSQGTVVVNLSQLSTHQALALVSGLLHLEEKALLLPKSKSTSQIMCCWCCSRPQEASAHRGPGQWRPQSPTWPSPSPQRGKDPSISLRTNECDVIMLCLCTETVR